MLTQAGFDIVAACDYRDALPILEGGRRIDLMLVDVVMPGRVHGVALARMARLRRRGLPVIFITGYEVGAAVEEGIPVLRKPVEPEALLAQIKQSLAR